MSNLIRPDDMVNLLDTLDNSPASDRNKLGSIIQDVGRCNGIERSSAKVIQDELRVLATDSKPETLVEDIRGILMKYDERQAPATELEKLAGKPELSAVEKADLKNVISNTFNVDSFAKTMSEFIDGDPDKIEKLNQLKEQIDNGVAPDNAVNVLFEDILGAKDELETSNTDAIDVPIDPDDLPVESNGENNTEIIPQKSEFEILEEEVTSNKDFFPHGFDPENPDQVEMKEGIMADIMYVRDQAALNGLTVEEYQNKLADEHPSIEVTPENSAIIDKLETQGKISHLQNDIKICDDRHHEFSDVFGMNSFRAKLETVYKTSYVIELKKLTGDNITAKDYMTYASSILSMIHCNVLEAIVQEIVYVVLDAVVDCVNNDKDNVTNEREEKVEVLDKPSSYADISVENNKGCDSFGVMENGKIENYSKFEKNFTDDKDMISKVKDMRVDNPAFGYYMGVDMTRKPSQFGEFEVRKIGRSEKVGFSDAEGNKDVLYVSPVRLVEYKGNSYFVNIEGKVIDNASTNFLKVDKGTVLSPKLDDLSRHNDKIDAIAKDRGITKEECVANIKDCSYRNTEYYFEKTADNLEKGLEKSISKDKADKVTLQRASVDIKKDICEIDDARKRMDYRDLSTINDVTKSAMKTNDLCDKGIEDSNDKTDSKTKHKSVCKTIKDCIAKKESPIERVEGCIKAVTNDGLGAYAKKYVENKIEKVTDAIESYKNGFIKEIDRVTVIDQKMVSDRGHWDKCTYKEDAPVSDRLESYKNRSEYFRNDKISIDDRYNSARAFIKEDRVPQDQVVRESMGEAADKKLENILDKTDRYEKTEDPFDKYMNDKVDNDDNDKVSQEESDKIAKEDQEKTEAHDIEKSEQDANTDKIENEENDKAVEEEKDKLESSEKDKVEEDEKDKTDDENKDKTDNENKDKTEKNDKDKTDKNEKPDEKDKVDKDDDKDKVDNSNNENLVEKANEDISQEDKASDNEKLIESEDNKPTEQVTENDKPDDGPDIKSKEEDKVVETGSKDDSEEILYQNGQSEDAQSKAEGDEEPEEKMQAAKDDKPEIEKNDTSEKMEDSAPQEMSVADNDSTAMQELQDAVQRSYFSPDETEHEFESFWKDVPEGTYSIDEIVDTIKDAFAENFSASNFANICDMTTEIVIDVCDDNTINDFNDAWNNAMDELSQQDESINQILGQDFPKDAYDEYYADKVDTSPFSEDAFSNDLEDVSDDIANDNINDLTNDMLEDNMQDDMNDLSLDDMTDDNIDDAVDNVRNNNDIDSGIDQKLDDFSDLGGASDVAGGAEVSEAVDAAALLV